MLLIWLLPNLGRGWLEAIVHRKLKQTKMQEKFYLHDINNPEVSLSLTTHLWRAWGGEKARKSQVSGKANKSEKVQIRFSIDNR